MYHAVAYHGPNNAYACRYWESLSHYSQEELQVCANAPTQACVAFNRTH